MASLTDTWIKFRNLIFLEFICFYSREINGWELKYWLYSRKLNYLWLADCISTENPRVNTILSLSIIIAKWKQKIQFTEFFFLQFIFIVLLQYSFHKGYFFSLTILLFISITFQPIESEFLSVIMEKLFLWKNSKFKFLQSL